MSSKPTVTRPTTVHDLLVEGPKSWERACALIAEVAAEVADGHARGLTHLALTPAAIVLDDTGAYDGILEHTELESSATTLHYTAPEILVDATPDERCDVYSLGAILLAVLSGRHPFRTQNATAQATIARILHDVPDLDIPGAPPALLALIENTLRKNPDRRTVTSAEFARVTRRLAAGSPVQRVAGSNVVAETTSPAPQPQPPGEQRSRINWAAGLVAVALFFGVIFAGAVVAKLVDGDDFSLDLARPVIRPVPESGGIGSTTSIALQPVDASSAVSEDDAGGETVEAEAVDVPDSGASASAAFVSALASAGTEPQVEVEAEVEVLGEEEEREPAGIEIVPILKSAWDEYELEFGERLDVNLLDNDSLGGREASVSLSPGALLPTGFLLTSTGRLAGIAQQCGVTETGYQLTTDDGVTSATILRIVVTDCDDGSVAGT